jgi:hypothetical protein
MEEQTRYSAGERTRWGNALTKHSGGDIEVSASGAHIILPLSAETEAGLSALASSYFDFGGAERSVRR